MNASVVCLIRRSTGDKGWYTLPPSTDSYVLGLSPISEGMVCDRLSFYLSAREIPVRLAHPACFRVWNSACNDRRCLPALYPGSPHPCIPGLVGLSSGAVGPHTSSTLPCHAMPCHAVSCRVLLLSLMQEADEFKFTTNIMRWRHKRDSRGRLEVGEDARPLLETNTRLVRWSDGSMQLLVGDEAFDVGEHSIDRWGSAPGTICCVLCCMDCMEY